MKVFIKCHIDYYHKMCFCWFTFQFVYCLLTIPMTVDPNLVLFSFQTTGVKQEQNWFYLFLAIN